MIELKVFYVIIQHVKVALLNTLLLDDKYLLDDHRVGSIDEQS